MRAVAAAISALPGRRGIVYHDVLTRYASTAARAFLEAHMLDLNGDPLLRAIVEEDQRQFKAEGHAEGKAEDILTVLAARDLTPTAAQRARILASRDVAELNAWLRTAVTAGSVDALFGP